MEKLAHRSIYRCPNPVQAPARRRLCCFFSIPWRRETASTKPHLLRFCMVQCSQARARKRISARSARGRASGGLEVIIPRAQSRVHGKSCARGFYFVWIFLKKGVDIGRISSYNNKALRRYAVNAMRNCVMVAPATLTRIVRVRILLPQPNGSISTTKDIRRIFLFLNFSCFDKFFFFFSYSCK